MHCDVRWIRLPLEREQFSSFLRTQYFTSVLSHRFLWVWIFLYETRTSFAKTGKVLPTWLITLHNSVAVSLCDFQRYCYIKVLSSTTAYKTGRSCDSNCEFIPLTQRIIAVLLFSKLYSSYINRSIKSCTPMQIKEEIHAHAETHFCC